MFETINYLEAALWCIIGLGFLFVAGVKPRIRARCVVLGVVFVAFGASDIVEVQTGAWWRPWWLLLWKGACVGILGGQLIQYVRRRRDESRG